MTVVVQLQARVAELEEQLRANSTNSSRPPSSDPPGLPRRKSKSTGRRPGGQKGHPGHHRQLLPEEEVDVILDHFPAACERCGTKLPPDPENNTVRHQVSEVPPISVIVTEHRLHRVKCPCCSRKTAATLPAGTSDSAFGGRLVALIAMLSGRYRMSRRDVEDALENLFGIRIGLGSIPRMEETVSLALQEPTEEVQIAVQRSSSANIDDTGWKEASGRAVLWNMNTPELAFYRITERKTAEAAQAILGEFDGILGSDRATTYSFYSNGAKQFCWAHLDRHFAKIAERGGKAKTIGKSALAQVDKIFAAWHLFRAGHIDREQLRAQIAPVRERLAQILTRGGCGHSKTENTCSNILKGFEHLWTFIEHNGVEPTNNSAERALRPAVRWRRVSFGTQSKAGSRYVERILTAAETCRRQGRNLLEFLTRAVSAFLSDDAAPSLLARPNPAA